MGLEGLGISSAHDAAQVALQPEIIRMLARRTAAAIPQGLQPAAPLTNVVDESNDGLAFKPQPRPVWSSPDKSTDGKISNNLSDLSVSTHLWQTLSGTTFDQSMLKSFASSVSKSSPENALDTTRKSLQRFGTRPVMTPLGDMTWKSCHDKQWDDSKHLTSGFHTEATADVCTCGKAFDVDDEICKRCSARRIAPTPEPVPQLQKAMYMIDREHPDPFERNNAWAEVYSERLYRTQITKFEENEAWMQKTGYFHPRINEKSIKIAESRAAPPLHERTSDIVTKRNDILDAKRKQQASKELDGHTFTPTLHPKSARRTDWKQSNLFRWDEKRTQKIKMNLEREQAATNKQCSFTPRIGGKTKEIVEAYAADKPVHERLVSDSKRRTREHFEEQQIMSDMQPKDFEDMWVDATKKSSVKSVSVCFSPRGASVDCISKASTPSASRGSKVEAKSMARASTALFHEVSSLQDDSARCSRSAAIGRQSRMSRASRFSKVKKASVSQGARQYPKPPVATSGINTVALRGDFARIADSLLPA
mmetsp:Transcript_122847/g.192830  ORF Transcript_122847/g.192830 Transcript_122847/m.192830 type:complete len:535 (-) Transcript_122847:210-1814(-)|eukprot:CAMPEP_0169114518 /NCGR_PEP_ID=MMETSP1015-20121227/28800_1 /TAXON_ID=342587 /ORGANISM="Karlodinium micrum, Strain CCMP2283" /LENGTH=534 /DNA_ID=CAMNT_0009176805 /DNA_START=58 /DNA_END=1662 /DNA_ORIENTATION=+